MRLCFSSDFKTSAGKLVWPAPGQGSQSMFAALLGLNSNLKSRTLSTLVFVIMWHQGWPPSLLFQSYQASPGYTLPSTLALQMPRLYSCCPPDLPLTLGWTRVESKKIAPKTFMRPMITFGFFISGNNEAGSKAPLLIISTDIHFKPDLNFVSSSRRARVPAKTAGMQRFLELQITTLNVPSSSSSS